MCSECDPLPLTGKIGKGISFSSCPRFQSNRIANSAATLRYVITEVLRAGTNKLMPITIPLHCLPNNTSRTRTLDPSLLAYEPRAVARRMPGSL